MRERLELIIEELKSAMADVDKVEAGSYGYKAAAPRARKSYGYKAAAPRARKAALTAIKELKELRAEIQNKKNSHN
jgi:hypothetical protein